VWSGVPEQRQHNDDRERDSQDPEQRASTETHLRLHVHAPLPCANNAPNDFRFHERNPTASICFINCDASGAPLLSSSKDRTAADRYLHQRVVPQPVDGILVPAGDRRRPRHHHFEHRVLDAIRIAAIRHRFRKRASTSVNGLSSAGIRQACAPPPAAAAGRHRRAGCRHQNPLWVSCGGRLAGRREAAYRWSWRLWRWADTRGNLSEQRFAT